MITLYHGSNVEIETINLDKCSPYKDFGKGFYLTDIKEQAKQMAVRRTRIAGEGKPTVTAYSFDERLLENSSLQVKLFDTPSKEWALFILANRKGLMQPVYDIVIGPIGRGSFSVGTLYASLNYLGYIGRRIDLQKVE